MAIEIWQFINPLTPAPVGPSPFDQIGYNKSALEVGELQAEFTRLDDSGMQFPGEPVEENGVTEVHARDPDGNLFSLLTTDSAAAVGVEARQKIDWLPSPSSRQAKT